MFRGARALIDQSLPNMMSSTSMKKRRKNYSSSDTDEAITKIQTGEISQAKSVHEYVIPCQILVRKCNNKRYNLADKIPGSLPVLGEAAEKDLVQ